MSQLEQLAKVTTVVADTGEIDAMRKYKPTDATTNPSLVLKALQQLKADAGDAKSAPEYEAVLDLACEYAKSKSKDLAEQLPLALDRISVEFGKRIMELIPGNVSTELDARLSFDVQGSVERALRILDIYRDAGVKEPEKRVLIKVASTWEGMQVCAALKEKGIRCNMTLLFSIWQAAAAAQIGGAFLISPFVGRITDWHKKDKGVQGFPIEEDPGPQSVRSIYRYYKTHGFDTIVMGASFRSKAQVLALAGCDYLTIGPKFLQELQDSSEEVSVQLEPSQKSEFADLLDVSEPNFRYGMNEDPMATEKLAEGIRKFAADAVKLEKILEAKLQQ